MPTTFSAPLCMILHPRLNFIHLALTKEDIPCRGQVKPGCHSKDTFFPLNVSRFCLLFTNCFVSFILSYTVIHHSAIPLNSYPKTEQKPRLHEKKRYIYGPMNSSSKPEGRVQTEILRFVVCTNVYYQK